MCHVCWWLGIGEAFGRKLAVKCADESGMTPDYTSGCEHGAASPSAKGKVGDVVSILIDLADWTVISGGLTPPRPAAAAGPLAAGAMMDWCR